MTIGSDNFEGDFYISDNVVRYDDHSIDLNDFHSDIGLAINAKSVKSDFKDKAIFHTESCLCKESTDPIQELEELSAEAALKLLLVRVHEVVAGGEVAPRVDLPAYLARLRRPPLGILPLLRLVLVDHLVALDVGDRLRGEAAFLVPALVEHLPDQIQLFHFSVSNSLPCFSYTTYLVIRMLLLPMNQIVLVGLGLLVAEGASLQGDQRLLAPSGSRAGHLALLDLPDDEAILQEVLLYPR